MIDWLQPALPEAEYIVADIAEGGAPMPELDSFDGVLLSGSEYGVYDDVPWMKPLRTFLEQTRVAGKPIFGICFGHQIMADVFGGKAEKAEVGNVVGARRFGDVDAHVWHQDQVTSVPPGARVTASAAHCPVGALAYDFPARSVQFHPEYTESHLREIFARGRDVLLDAAKADAALASFEKAQVATDLQAQETAAFFRQNCAD